MRPIYLSHLTAPESDPFASLRIAHETGYQGLGLRLADPATGQPTSPLVNDTALRRRFCTELGALGLVVAEIEARVLEDGASLSPQVFQAAADLGAPDIIAVGPPSAPLQALEERFAALCDAAAAFGLRMGFEPIAHRAGGTLSEALAIVAAGRATGARLVLDALHVDRMGVTPAEIAGLDSGLIAVFHLCDAPLRPADLATQIDHSARNRWAPGDGVLPLRACLAALPPHLPLALEVPAARLWGRVTPRAHAAHCLRRARDFLSQTEIPTA